MAEGARVHQVNQTKKEVADQAMHTVKLCKLWWTPVSTTPGGYPGSIKAFIVGAPRGRHICYRRIASRAFDLATNRAPRRLLNIITRTDNTKHLYV